MSKTESYECIVCGRKFPHGQGIIISRGGVVLAFHSKACLARFFRVFVEVIDEKEFKKSYRLTVEEFKKLRELKSKPKQI